MSDSETRVYTDVLSAENILVRKGTLGPDGTVVLGASIMEIEVGQAVIVALPNPDATEKGAYKKFLLIRTG